MPDQKHFVRTRDDLPPGHWLARQLPTGASLRIYAEERAIINLTRQVQAAIDEAGLSRADLAALLGTRDRKSTRLNSSHQIISYAVFCLKKKINPPHCSHLDMENTH